MAPDAASPTPEPEGSTPDDAPGEGANLRRDLGYVDATSVMVGSMIGSGIFIVPGLVAEAVPHPGLIVGVWIFAGLLILAGAITFAELAAAFPESGGAYAFIREAFGQPWAFLNGWAIFAANKTASVAVLAFLFATYVADLVPLPAGWGVKTVALALIVLLTALNYVGVRYAGIVQSLSTILKVVALVAIAAAGLAFAPQASDAGQVLSLPQGLGLLSAVGVALVPAFFAYDGWANAPQIGDEVRNPERNLPLALITGMLLVTVVYALMNVAYLKVLGTAGFAESLFPAAEVAEALVGPAGRDVIVATVLVSLFGTTNAVIISGPRVYYAMARDGVFFDAVEGVHERFGTPHVSILLQGAWASVLLLLGTFEALLNYVIIVSWIFYGLAAYGVFKLRRDRPGLERPYEAWGYPWVPAVFVLLAAGFVVNSLVRLPVDSIAGLLLVASGLPFYHFWSTGRVLPVWLREALSREPAETRPWPREGDDLDRPEQGLLEYLVDIERHGAVFDAAEAAEALGVSEAAVYQALSGLREKRPDAVEVGYWGGDLHVRAPD